MNKFLKVLIKPSEVFGEEKEKASLGKALITFLSTSFIIGAINVMGFFLNPKNIFLVKIINLILPINVQIIRSIIAIFYLVFLPIFTIIIVFLSSLLGFAISKLFGGTGNYRTLLYLTSIYYVPLGLITTILSQIPGIGQYIAYIAMIYIIYPFTIALKESFSLSLKRAIIVWLIPTLIILPIISYPVLKDWYQNYESKKFSSDVDFLLDAIKSDNINICKSISDSLIKDRCIAIIKRDITKCRGGDDICFSEIAKKTNNIDLCLSLKFSSTRIECVTEIAITTKDSSLCAKLSDELNGVGWNKDKWSERKECFYRVGINLKDVSACSLTDETRIVTCTAIAKDDINICNQLQESYKIQECESIFHYFLKK